METIKQKALERFLRYIKIDTRSQEDSDSFPSTKTSSIWQRYWSGCCAQPAAWTRTLTSTATSWRPCLAKTVETIINVVKFRRFKNMNGVEIEK
jgi:hypothetical protein